MSDEDGDLQEQPLNESEPMLYNSIAARLEKAYSETLRQQFQPVLFCQPAGTN